MNAAGSVSASAEKRRNSAKERKWTPFAEW